MDGYLFILYVGFGGMLLMTLLGLSHHHLSGRAAPGHSHFGPHATAMRGKGPSRHQHSAQSGGGRVVHLLLAALSPRLIFSLLLGFGAAGVLLRPLATHWPIFLLPVVAAIEAGIFERYVVQPFWALLSGFASRPAQTLESLVHAESCAVTNFDAAGHGLIAVHLDGQVRQLLGRLAPSEGEHTADGARVRAGQRLLIRAVDLQRNSCTVSRVD